MEPDLSEANCPTVKEAQDPFVRRAEAFVAKLDKPPVVTEHVPKGVYVQYVKNELDRESACMELPLTILLLLSFSTLALTVIGQVKVYSVEEAIRFDIVENANFAFAHAMGHKGIEDVNSISDFWSWFRRGFLPLIVQPTWAYSEDYQYAVRDQWLLPGYQNPVPITGDYLRYHRMVGGIRMRQWVADSGQDLCRFPVLRDRNVLEQWWGKPCSPSKAGELTPLIQDMEVLWGMERVQWLFPELDSLDTLKATALDMEDGCTSAKSIGSDMATSCLCTWCQQQNPVQPWLDEATSRIEVSFVLYNPSYGLYSYVGVNFFFNRGGHIYKFIHIMSVWADLNTLPMQTRILVYFSGLLWGGALMYVFISETKEVISTVRHSKKRWYSAIKDDYMGPWNAIDWISIAIGLIVASLFTRMTSAIRAGNEQLYEMMLVSQQAPGVDRALYEATNQLFFEAAANMALEENHFRKSLCIYPIIVMIRLFKSFAAQPRLALVTATLSHAKPDIVHFVIVFASVFICMMVNSMLFFGQDVEDFSTFERALHTCFLAMMGDWDWMAMREIGHTKGGLWFWLFAVIMVLVLLNMLLAIVMDSYAAEKAKVQDAIALPKQVAEQWRRWRQSYSGQRVRLNEVLAVFRKLANNDEQEMLNSEDRITADYLMQHVEKMKIKQATRQVESAVAYKREEDSNETTDEDVLEFIKSLLVALETRQRLIHAEAQFVAETLHNYDEIQAHGDFEYDMLFGSTTQNSVNTKQNVPDTVTQVSEALGGRLMESMRCLESWQDDFEHHQEELHGIISELQLMVMQQAKSISTLTELTGLPPTHPSSDHPHRGLD